MHPSAPNPAYIGRGYKAESVHVRAEMARSSPMTLTMSDSHELPDITPAPTLDGALPGAGLISRTIAEHMPSAHTEAAWVAEDLARAFPGNAARPAMRAQTIMVPADLPPGLVSVVSQQATTTALRLYNLRRSSAQAA